MKPLFSSLLVAAAISLPLAASAQAAQDEPIKAVYHINEAEKIWPALRNVQNHLRDDPRARIVIVTNSAGIDFLLKDAVDKQGTPFQPTLTELKGKGVEFKVCRNTLTARKLTDEAVAPEATVIQAGVSEIARLQARGGYVYLKP